MVTDFINTLHICFLWWLKFFIHRNLCHHENKYIYSLKHHHHHHQSVLPRAGPSLQPQEIRLQFWRRQVCHQKPRLQFYKGLNRCSSFALLSIPHSFFSIWIDLKRSENIPGTPTWRWREWIWLTGPFRTSPKFTTEVKNQFDQDFFTRSETRKSQSPFAPIYNFIYRV